MPIISGLALSLGLVAGEFAVSPHTYGSLEINKLLVAWESYNVSTSNCGCPGGAMCSSSMTLDGFILSQHDCSEKKHWWLFGDVTSLSCSYSLFGDGQGLTVTITVDCSLTVIN
jgi:hypothetical protein